jgi:beta-glucosidase
LLKTELGFRGYVVTDWNTGHNNTGAANAGLDMGMPSELSPFNHSFPPHHEILWFTANLTHSGTDSTGKNPFWGSALQSAIGSGVASIHLDDMVKRILASWYLTKQDSGYPSIAATAKGGSSGRNVQGNHSATARAMARDGIVLLKNSGNLLPLQKPKSITILARERLRIRRALILVSILGVIKALWFRDRDRGL